jgi:hypothetical protein
MQSIENTKNTAIESPALEEVFEDAPVDPQHCLSFLQIVRRIYRCRTFALARRLYHAENQAADCRAKRLSFLYRSVSSAKQRADHPGTRMIYLAYSEKPDSYFDFDRTELWHPTANANEFALLMDFIGTLPFKATGRMLIMYDDVAREVPAHRDHIETELCHDFLWFRTNTKKPFYMLNHKTGEKNTSNLHGVVRFGQSISRQRSVRRIVVQHSR